MTRRGLLVATAVLALLLVIAAVQLRGPAPLPASAPSDRFSAERAVAVLRDLLREEVPHPVGTPANHIVRDRILDRFRGLGYEASIHRAFVCNATPSCATVENILATVPGDRGPWVLLVAHYDSVPAGPGASDDGVGMAALLEAARAVGGTAGISFLITDGEEAGLLGAEAFVASPLKERVTSIVNLENRGTSGPSFLFETSRGNAGLVPAIRALQRPNASSLFYTIYELLPNDTDVTVFKRDGLQSMNFAAIGNVAYYHTPLDDLSRVNLRTLQHHGDNALAAARALQQRFEPAQHNAVFFDVMNIALVSWPERWTLWIALGSLAVLFIGARDASWRDLLAGACLTIVALSIAAAAAVALVWLAHLRAGPFGRVAYPQPVIAAMWLTGITAVLIAFRFTRSSERRSLYAGASLVWHGLAVALASSLPGTAFLFLVPAIASSICVAARARPLVAAIAPAATAGMLLFPLALFLYPALGKTGLLPVALLVAMVATTVVPWIEGRVWPLSGGMAGIAIAAALIANGFPVFTAERPRREAIEHELPSPTVEAAVERTGDAVTIRLTSAREADRVMLEFDGQVDILRINGVAPAPPNPGRVWRGALTVFGDEAVVELRAPDGIEIVASDLTYGLPPEAGARAARRDASGAVTTHRGDVTVSRRKARI
ncbi:MAG TPA: M28 family peptidase [Thermoanaerobaculia bacterium]|nr:M28 family peptidase [Thermoanaerobaculia bacterium]